MECNGKKLGSILWNGCENMLVCWSADGITVREYKDVLLALLDRARPGLFVEAVGPDPVLYRSKVATYWTKYLREVCTRIVPGHKGTEELDASCNSLDRFVREGTDVLQMGIEVCREMQIPIVASLRMNAADSYHGQLAWSDFGRQNPHLALPGRNCYDLAKVEVFMHWLDIFRELVETYDIDGIELNWRRSPQLISYPLHNYPVLTRMVSDLRRILDDAAAKKGRSRMLLGARVGPLLEGPFVMEEFSGANVPTPTNQSCQDLGLDVRQWVKAGYVDYICPMLWNECLPGTARIKEFADLTQNTDTGVYGNVWTLPRWMHKGPEAGPVEPEDTQRLRRYKGDICEALLKIYDDGADGITTFNWYMLHVPEIMSNHDHIGKRLGVGVKKLLLQIYPLLRDRARLETYARSEELLS